MSKTAKGALAASAAAVLLAGGAGTLAFWTASDTVNGGSVTAGKLTLAATGCDANWVYASGSKVNTTVVKFVPGDSIKKSCRFTIGALGDNLQATPTVPSSVPLTTAPANANLTATVASTYALSGGAAGAPTGPLAATDKITQANDGQTLTANLVVTFPYGSATVNPNSTQNVVATLDALTVTLTQDKGAGNPNA